MIKLLLLVLFLAELGLDVNPLDYLTTFDKRATCQRMMTRFIKCADPQVRKFLQKRNFRQKMIQECVKRANKKQFRKGTRCLRYTNCKKFNACIMR